MQAHDTTATVYYVRSSRDPSKFYTVAENPRGFLECDCPAATFYRARPCKHAEQVRRGCGLRARPKAAPVADLTIVQAPGEALAEAVMRAVCDSRPTPAPRRSQAEQMADFGGVEVRA